MINDEIVDEIDEMSTTHFVDENEVDANDDVETMEPRDRRSAMTSSSNVPQGFKFIFTSLQKS